MQFPLISLRLIVLCAGLAVLVGAATVVVWRRFGRWRLVTRPVGVLLFEVLLLITVGLVVNRAERFYPSWQALRGDVAEQAPVVAAPLPDGMLDPWLRERAAPDGSVTVSWEPAPHQGWRLRSAPTLAVPAGYLRQPGAYPAVISLLDARHSWDVPRTATVARAATESAGPAVLLALAPSPQTGAGDFGAAVVTELDRSLRLTRNGWALVAPVAEVGRAVELIRGVPVRFSSLTVLTTDHAGPQVTVDGLPATFPVALVKPTGPRQSPSATPSRSAPGPGPSARGTPTGGTPSPTAPATGRVIATVLPSAAGVEWATALSWAFRQVPAPLAPPVSLPSLPPEAPR